jgi:hypothetical protein
LRQPKDAAGRSIGGRAPLCSSSGGSGFAAHGSDGAARARFSQGHLEQLRGSFATLCWWLLAPRALLRSAKPRREGSVGCRAATARAGPQAGAHAVSGIALCWAAS